MVKFVFAFLLSSLLFIGTAHAVNRGYVILPGDVLQVSVWKEDDMDQEVVILPDGSFSFPLIGTVHAENKTPAELQDIVLEKIKVFIPEAAVTVVVKAPFGHKASIIGEVQTPGDVILGSITTVTQALSQVGGFSPYADKDSIIIIRKNTDGTKEKIQFSYSDLSKGKNLKNDIDLIPGDIIVVPASGLF
ncbi:MAG: polysaccharide biosynthesis/export family protein [Alphaproteobacteria bacterium]